ncbi:MAG TPA: sulfatase-like hydrolase/transferase [Candidatus Polarisedimenticolaceae bacterium]
MSKGIRPGLAAALTALCVVAACRPAETEHARHVILVTLDTVRADRIGCYGRPSAGTPWLDGLAARGMRVERAYAPAPITLPSHVSLLSGLIPPHTGVHDNGDTKTVPGVRMLAERLSEAGFFTAAAVGGFPVASRFPVARGFQQFDDRFVDARNPAGLERDAGEVVRAAIRAASGRGGRRLFLWVHLFDAHDPYEPPDPWRSRYKEDPYQGEIARVDAALADLESGLRPVLGAEPTLWVVVSDHGEGLGEHGEETHGFFLYEPTVRVPLLLAGPGVEAGRVIPGPVGTVDVTPTILDRVGVPVPPGLDGRPVTASGSGRPIAIETLLPARHYGWSALHSAVDGRKKYIEAPRAEFYDVVDDPQEAHNRLGEWNEEAEELAGWLRELRGSGRDASAASPDPRLASLGYVGSGASKPRNGAPADPKDMLAIYRDFQRVGRLLESGRPQDALPVLDRLTRAGETDGIRFQRARALRMLGRLSEASEELAQLEGFPGASLERARIAAAMGDGPRTLREANKHLLEAPSDAEGLLFRGAGREMTGDPGAAEADYRAALEVNPAFGAASLRLIRLVVLAGRVEEARSLLRLHLTRHPDDTLARNLLAEL